MVSCPFIIRITPASFVPSSLTGFSVSGLAQVGVALAEGDGPWVFIGIIPMIDPPRHDTPQTIYKIQAAGVRVSHRQRGHATS